MKSFSSTWWKNYLSVQSVSGAWGSVVVKALCGSPPTKPCALRWLSLWKWVPGISPGVKAAGAYGWRPTTFAVPNVKKIQDLNLPRTPWATSACYGMTFTFTNCQ